MKAARVLIAVVLSCCGLTLYAAYGVKFNPADTNAAQSAYLVSENAFVLRMRQPDGKIRHFSRDFDHPERLYGDDPWVGEDMGNGTIRIITHPEFKGGRTGFVFQNGHLRIFATGRKRYQYEQGSYPHEEAPLETLWPEELTKEEAVELFSTWKDAKDGRLRLGYRNPNKAGCLCAELVLLALALLFCRRRWVKALGAVAAAGALVPLVMTGSRSAIVALAFGLLAFGVVALRRFLTWRRGLVALVGGLLLVAAIVFLGGGMHLFSGTDTARQQSDAFRLSLWRELPHMVVDSPDGWGLGVSGRAYTSWYQPPNETRIVRTLVNSHATWLVEFGWCGRFLYLFGLAGLLMALGVLALRRQRLAPFVTWSSLVICGAFNSVMEAPTLWIVPGASLLIALPTLRQTLTRRVLTVISVGSAGVAVVMLGVLLALGVTSRRTPSLCGNATCVRVNGVTPKTWVVDDGVVLGGGLMGKELRMYYAAFPSEPPTAFVWRVQDLPTDVENLVLAGKAGRDFLELLAADVSRFTGVKRVLFLSPPFAAEAIPSDWCGGRVVRLVRGDLAAAHLLGEGAVRSVDIQSVSGAELYVVGWMKLATHPDKW